MESSNTQQSKKVIRLQSVREKCGGVSAATIWSWAKNSEKTGFPRPFALSPGCTVWDESEVDAFLQLKKNNSHDLRA